MGSNPSTGYWMDIFQNCCKSSIVCLKINEKEAMVGSFVLFKKYIYLEGSLKYAALRISTIAIL